MTTTKRGGRRPNSGRPPINGGTRSIRVTLDERTEATMRCLADGNLSAGIRAAAKIIRERKMK